MDLLATSMFGLEAIFARPMPGQINTQPIRRRS